MFLMADYLDFRELNRQIKTSTDDVEINNCIGQRYIGSGVQDKNITIYGTPGNALGSYLNGANIVVHGNVQDAVGDTMNSGKIIIHGNAGDALGYAMRGGSIFVRGNAGYRTGIHMKQYQDKKPVIVIGGTVGSFLGEYMAGGLIIVLGIDSEDVPVGDFIGTGMHGGKIFIRTDKELTGLPAQVITQVATEDDIQEIYPYISEFAELFDMDTNLLCNSRYYMLKPNAKNPYKQLYTAN